MDLHRQPGPGHIQYVLREVSTEVEMRDVLALRKRVYEQMFGEQDFNVVARAAALDFDAFDLTSHHFALIAREGANDRVAGSLRITTNKPGPMEEVLRRIAQENRALSSELKKGRPARLPMLAHLPRESGAQEAIASLDARGGFLAEPGRLAVENGHRTTAGRNGLRLARFMVECACGFGWHSLGLSDAVLACQPMLVPLYEAYGFSPLPGTSVSWDAAVGVHFVVMHATPGSLPAALRPRVRARADELCTTGEVLVCPPAGQTAPAHDIAAADTGFAPCAVPLAHPFRPAAAVA